MKNYALLILLLVTGAAHAQVANIDSAEVSKPNEALDNRYGFLGNKFDTSFSMYKGLVFVENYKGYKIYKKAVDIKAFGKAKITTVHYSFYKGQLAAVQVKAINNLQNEEAWRELLKAAYGPAQDSLEAKEDDDMLYHTYGGNYLWHGRKANINLSIHINDPISVYVSSSIVGERKRKDEAAALKKAAQKL